jgi:molybdopterin-guanine dinucleotide biosynthesis protein A
MRTETAVNAFVSCDMPFIDGRLIQRLASGCCDVAPVVASLHPEEGLQPFPLVCHTKAGVVVGALLNRGLWSLRGLLAEPEASVIQIEEPELWRSFANINTMADYSQLCGRGPG